MRGAEKLGGQPVIPKSRAADINLEKQVIPRAALGAYDTDTVRGHDGSGSLLERVFEGQGTTQHSQSVSRQQVPDNENA
jgi:hypothetical protein